LLALNANSRFEVLGASGRVFHANGAKTFRTALRRECDHWRGEFGFVLGEDAADYFLHSRECLKSGITFPKLGGLTVPSICLAINSNFDSVKRLRSALFAGSARPYGCEFKR
jgi:hypothetical protein